jgi:hypothetical protein
MTGTSKRGWSKRDSYEEERGHVAVRACGNVQTHQGVRETGSRGKDLSGHPGQTTRDSSLGGPFFVKKGVEGEGDVMMVGGA